MKAYDTPCVKPYVMKPYDIRSTIVFEGGGPGTSNRCCEYFKNVLNGNRKSYMVLAVAIWPQVPLVKSGAILHVVLDTYWCYIWPLMVIYVAIYDTINGPTRSK